MGPQQTVPNHTSKISFFWILKNSFCERLVPNHLFCSAGSLRIPFASHAQLASGVPSWHQQPCGFPFQ